MNNQAKKETKKIIPFTMASKRKYLGINLTNKVKNLYTDNYKPCQRKIFKTYIKWKDIPYTWIEDLIMLKWQQ